MVTRDSHFRAVLKYYHRDSYVSNKNRSHLDSGLPVIDCSLGHSPFYFTRSYDSYLKALTSDDLAKYPSEALFEEFRGGIRRRFGEVMSSEQIFFGHGSFNIIERVFHKVLAPETLLGLSPQFLELPSEFVAAGGTYKPVPFQDPLTCIDRLVHEITSGRSTALYFDNPNNPTGYAFSLANVERLASACDQSGTVFIVDEAYGDYLPDSESAIALVPKYDNLIVVRSFSKCFGLAAIRSGYAVISENLLSPFSQIDVPFEPGSVSIVLSIAALQDREFLTRIRSRSEKVKSYFLRHLEELGFFVFPTNPSTPIFVMRSNVFPEFAETLRSLNVLCVPGSLFTKSIPIIDDSSVRVRIPSSYGAVDEFVRRLKGVLS